MLKQPGLFPLFALCAVGWQPEAPEAGLSVPRTGSQAAILLEGHCFSMFPQLSCQILWTQMTAKDILLMYLWPIKKTLPTRKSHLPQFTDSNK